MGAPFTISLVYGVVAAAANLLGAYLCTRARPARGSGRLVVLRGIGAGFLLGVVVVDAIPAGFMAWRGHFGIAVGLLGLGYAALHGIERILARVGYEHHHSAHQHPEHEPPSAHLHCPLSRAAAWTGILGLSLHTLLDGAAVAASAAAELSGSALIALGLVLHQAPVGASAAALALSTRGSLRDARIAGGLVAAASMGGAAAFVFAARLGSLVLPAMAGITLHVVVHDLLPTVAPGGMRRTAVLLLLGAVLYLGTEALVRLAQSAV